MASSAQATSHTKGRKRKLKYTEEVEIEEKARKVARRHILTESVHHAYTRATSCFSSLCKSVTGLGTWTCKHAGEYVPGMDFVKALSEIITNNSPAAEPATCTPPLTKDSLSSWHEEATPVPGAVPISCQSGRDLSNRTRRGSSFASAKRGLQLLSYPLDLSQPTFRSTPCIAPQGRTASCQPSPAAHSPKSTHTKGQSASVHFHAHQPSADVRGPVSASLFNMEHGRKGIALQHRSPSLLDASQLKALASIRVWKKTMRGSLEPVVAANGSAEEHPESGRDNLPRREAAAASAPQQRPVSSRKAPTIAEEMYTSPSPSAGINRGPAGSTPSRSRRLSPAGSFHLKSRRDKRASLATPSKSSGSSDSIAVSKPPSAEPTAGEGKEDVIIGPSVSGPSECAEQDVGVAAGKQAADPEQATFFRSQPTPETCSANLDLLAAAAVDEAQPAEPQGPELASWESWVESLEVVDPAAGTQICMIPCPSTDLEQADSDVLAEQTPPTRIRRVSFNVPENTSARIEDGGTPNRRRRVPRLRGRLGSSAGGNQDSMQGNSCSSEQLTPCDGPPSMTFGSAQRSADAAYEEEPLAGCEPMEIDSAGAAEGPERGTEPASISGSTRSREGGSVHAQPPKWKVEDLPSMSRRIAYQRPWRSEWGYMVFPKPPSEAISLVQKFRDALLNERLATSWEAGEMWAATDYYGQEMTPALCARHKDAYGQAQAQVVLRKGMAPARCLKNDLEQEWELLKGVRLKYARSPAQGLVAGGGGTATPRSILKRKSAMALQQEAAEAASKTAVRILHDSAAGEDWGRASAKLYRSWV